MGNVARFFNHSCEPNMRPVKIIKSGAVSGSSGSSTKRSFENCPTMAFFAVRNIVAGEELTWKYIAGGNVKKTIGFKCECGSPYCCSAST